jgi:hypothetical protein
MIDVGTRQTRPAPKRFRPARRRDALCHHWRVAGHLVRTAAAPCADGAARGQGTPMGLSVRRQPQLHPALRRRRFVPRTARARGRAATAARGDRDPQGPDRGAELRDPGAGARRIARRLEKHRRRHVLPRSPGPPAFVRRLAAHAARGDAGHRRGDPLSALQSRRLALCARHHRRGDDQAADRRGRARARAAIPPTSRSSKGSQPQISRPRSFSICLATCAPIGSTA